MNTRVGWRQACLSGFIASPSPSPDALADENSDNVANNDDEDENKDASSSSDEEMTTS